MSAPAADRDGSHIIVAGRAELACGGQFLPGVPHSIPVGAKMRVELSGEPQGTLSEDDELELFFIVTKVGDDG